MNWLKNKIRNWLFKDEIEKINKTISTTNEILLKIDKITEYVDKSSQKYNNAILLSKKQEELLDECRKTMNSICDIGTDIGFHSDDHSWAVVCIHGKIDYVKFVPMTKKDTMEISRFLKRFEYSNMMIDSPFGYREMIEDMILKS